MSVSVVASPCTVPHRATQWQGLIVILECLLAFPQAAINYPDVGERSRLARAIPDGAPKRQGLIVIFQRLLLIPEVEVRPNRYVQRSRFARAVTHGALDR